MNVFVIGAHGKIGTHLLPKLRQAGYNVYAGIRKEQQAEQVKAADATPVMIDLLGPVDTLAQQLKSMDAVIFTAGSGGSTGDDMTLLVDLDGAVKAMEASKTAGVRRFVIVSSAASDHRQTWGQVIRPYMAAKYYADKQLVNSGLDYTIIRPGILTDEAETGRFSTDPKDGLGKQIARADVAQFIAAVVGTPSTITQTYNIVNGTNTLAEVFN